MSAPPSRAPSRKSPLPVPTATRARLQREGWPARRMPYPDQSASLLLGIEYFSRLVGINLAPSRKEGIKVEGWMTLPEMMWDPISDPFSSRTTCISFPVSDLSCLREMAALRLWGRAQRCTRRRPLLHTVRSWGRTRAGGTSQEAMTESGQHYGGEKCGHQAGGPANTTKKEKVE
ncbi:hypothetical protein K438DRAFT_1773944 [Mycena galopus ATCC 62051]|nr:hypothetical protein K438DRAFT_1773944 [Mycena galopus ATCC 62051]